MLKVGNYSMGKNKSGRGCPRPPLTRQNPCCLFELPHYALAVANAFSRAFRRLL
jgi:hypothetical protein